MKRSDVTQKAAAACPPVQDERLWELRPHHLLDIVTSHGRGEEFQPHPYGHAVHVVAQALLASLDMRIRFVVGADDICRPCKHLDSDGRCDDLVRSLRPPVSKQEYNDGVDRRLLEHLGLAALSVMTAREFLQLVDKYIPGLERLCAHPSETPESRLAGLEQGLRKLGVRRN